MKQELKLYKEKNSFYSMTIVLEILRETVGTNVSTSNVHSTRRLTKIYEF